MTKFKKKYTIVRDKNLLHSVVLVDGQAGCGKTLINSITASMQRVELLNYSTELENLCILKELRKIDDDAVQTMIKIQMDHVLYETMMSRRVNFRIDDLSSAFKDVKVFTYIKRLFEKGDEIIPSRIKKNNPILHFAVHNLLPISKPVFLSLQKKLKFIEVIRHPLYMIIQQTLNHINISKNNGSARQFRIYLDCNNKKIPFTSKEFHQKYFFLQPVERAILEMENFYNLSNRFKKENSNLIKNLITIPFEDFVLNPEIYIKKIAKLLDTNISKKTKKVMIKQKIPRKKISDGIPLNIYKRCGWTPPVTGISEKEELSIRRDFVIKQKAKSYYIDLFDKLSDEYEKNILKILFS